MEMHPTCWLGLKDIYNAFWRGTFNAPITRKEKKVPLNPIPPTKLHANHTLSPEHKPWP